MAEISEEPPCPKRTKLTDPGADGHGVTPLTVKVQGQEEHLTCDLSEEAKAQALYMAALSHLDEAATAFTKLVGTHEMSTAVRGKFHAIQEHLSDATLSHQEEVESCTELLNPRHTAILAIEYQNDFVHVDGKAYPGLNKVLHDTDMLRKSFSLIADGRRAGALVLHCPCMLHADYREISDDCYGALQNLKERGALQEGTWGAEFHDDFQPQEENGDVVIRGKRGFDAFASSDLDFILRQRGIRNLVVCGFLTNCCVQSTATSAYERGYNTVVVGECCATTSSAAQEATLTHICPLFTKVWSKNTAITALRNGQAEEAGETRLLGMSKELVGHLFGELDVNHDGSIDAKELRALGRRMGETWCNKTLEEIMVSADSNGDGIVDFEELYDWLLHNCTCDAATLSGLRIRNHDHEGGGACVAWMGEKAALYVAKMDEFNTGDHVHAGGSATGVSDDGAAAKKKGTLRAHLISVGKILHGWGLPKPVWLAGLFHSFYETQGGLNAMGKDYEAKRPQLEALLEKEAAELVWNFQSANRSCFPPFKGGYSANPKSWPLHDTSILFAPEDAPDFQVYDFRDNTTLLTLPSRLRWPLLEMVLANAYDQVKFADEDAAHALLFVYQLRGVFGVPWVHLSEGCQHFLNQYVKSAMSADWGEAEELARATLVEVRFPLRVWMQRKERGNLDPVEDVDSYIDAMRQYHKSMQPNMSQLADT